MYTLSCTFSLAWLTTTSRVASLDKSWRELFSHAGLSVARKGGLTWHDLRHEFVVFLQIRAVKFTRYRKRRATRTYARPSYMKRARND
jgi:hypothetical protein